MDNRVIFSTVGNELEDFAQSLKYLHMNIRVKFYAKMHPYGCKIVIDAKDKRTEKTFFNCLLKIRLVKEFDALKVLLQGMKTSIETFCHKQYADSSDTN